MLQLKNQTSGSKTMCGFSILLILKEFWRFKVILLNKNVIKTEQNQKWKIPHTVLERRTLCFSSCKNRKLKVRKWWVGARERKNRTFFVPFILSKGNFFKICVLSQCIGSWIHFRNIHNFTNQKTLLHTLLLLVPKIVESLPCILKSYYWEKLTFSEL